MYSVPTSVATTDPECHDTSTSLLLSSYAVTVPVSSFTVMSQPTKSPLASLASVSAAVIVPGTSSCAGRQVHAGDGQSSAVAWASSSHAACEVEVEAYDHESRDVATGSLEFAGESEDDALARRGRLPRPHQYRQRRIR